MKFSSRRRPEASINLTPLIDIMFIVLVFLVLTATFGEQSVLRIALPRAETGEPRTSDTQNLRILVDADGNLAFDGQVRTLEEVAERLRALPDPDEAAVTIVADEQAGHGRVIAVVDQIRQAGIFRLSIQTLAGGTTIGVAR